MLHLTAMLSRCLQPNLFLLMTLKIFLATLVFSLLAFSSINGQAVDTTQKPVRTYQTDSTTIANSSNANEQDDFAPGLFFFALIGIGLVFVCIGIGPAIAAAGLLVIFGLVGLGILSTSVIIGLNQKSVTKGFKTFLLLLAVAGGVCICTTAFYLIKRLFNLHLALNDTLVIGAASGLLGGLLLGQSINIVFGRLINFFKQRLNIV